MIDDKKAKLKAMLANKGSKGTTSSSTGGDNASFPFWNTKTGETSVLRLLPDLDQDNPRFWVPREIINLEFDGVVGGDYPTDQKVSLTVPCMTMYGGREKCPITEAIRPWWNTDKHELARKYYRKQSIVTQGFVVTSPVQEKEVPENPIRRFVFNSQLAKVVEQEVEDDDFPYLPVDYVHGRDLRIIVTQNGTFNSYTSSKFSPKERSLTDEELAAIETHNLFNLRDYLPAKPNEQALEYILQLFQDSVDGLPFDMDKYANSPYKPYVRREGGAEAAKTTSAPVETVAPARVKAAPAPVAAADDEDEAEVATSKPAAKAETPLAAPVSSTSAQDILARIRNKSAASGQ